MAGAARRLRTALEIHFRIKGGGLADTNTEPPHMVQQPAVRGGTSHKPGGTRETREYKHSDARRARREEEGGCARSAHRDQRSGDAAAIDDDAAPTKGQPFTRARRTGNLIEPPVPIARSYATPRSTHHARRAHMRHGIDLRSWAICWIAKTASLYFAEIASLVSRMSSCFGNSRSVRFLSVKQ